jgi:rhamnosyl/mannosyltransferase
VSKLKVLQINKLYAPWIGGVERVVQEIAEGLNGKTDMKVLVCQPKGRAVSDIYNGIPVTRTSSFGIFFSMPISLDFIPKLREMSKEADILQFHAPFPLGDLAYLVSGYKGKVVVWWHSDIVNQKFLLRLISPMIKSFLKRADLIIVATQAHIESSKFLKSYASKCRVIPFGLRFGDYEHVTIKNFLTDKLNNAENKKLLFVGRFVNYKGIKVLINAMKQIEGAELFIVGTGILNKKIRRVTHRQGLSEKIHFLGYLPFEELKAAYADCDIFVFPSRANSEAFGIVQLEAMFYGKPVVNTNLPTGVPSVSIHNETGLTVEVNDVDALTVAVQRLVDDDALREKFGANAVKRVRENFDVDRMLENLYDEYEKLMEI